MITVLPLQITPEVLAQLRALLSPTPAEIDALALALVERMKREQMQASASLTVAEFAKQARVTAGYVHQLIREGKLEATRPSGKGDRRITAAAAAAYFAGGKHGNGG